MPGRILICGSREWNDSEAIEFVIDKLISKYGDDISIIHGAARGADSLAGQAATKRELVTVSCPAKWGKYDKKAGTIRNQFMLDRCKPQLVIAFNEDLENSKGTGHMVRIAKKVGVPAFCFICLQHAKDYIDEQLPESLRSPVVDS